jgi:quercetin dioxygenase-like cupin family protein
MFTQTLEDSPRNYRGGQVSYLLLKKGQFGSGNLAITWVEGGPGSEQPPHAHPTNEQEVTAGTLVFVPPGTSHAIRNTGNEPVVFVSATAPPFDLPPEGSVFAYEPPAVP